MTLGLFIILALIVGTAARMTIRKYKVIPENSPYMASELIFSSIPMCACFLVAYVMGVMNVIELFEPSLMISGYFALVICLSFGYLKFKKDVKS